jgi:hypothetical protein
LFSPQFGQSQEFSSSTQFSLSITPVGSNPLSNSQSGLAVSKFRDSFQFSGSAGAGVSPTFGLSSQLPESDVFSVSRELPIQGPPETALLIGAANESPTTSNGLGGLIGGICALVVLVLLILVFWQRWRSQKKNRDLAYDVETEFREEAVEEADLDSEDLDCEVENCESSGADDHPKSDPDAFFDLGDESFQLF